MPTNLPLITKTARKFDIPVLLFFAFYLTCFVIMAVFTVPSMAETFAMATP